MCLLGRQCFYLEGIVPYLEVLSSCASGDLACSLDARSDVGSFFEAMVKLRRPRGFTSYSMASAIAQNGHELHLDLVAGA